MGICAFDDADGPVDLSLFHCLKYLDLGGCRLNQQELYTFLCLPCLKILKVVSVMLSKKIEIASQENVEKRCGLQTLVHVLAQQINFPQMQTIESIQNLLPDGFRVVAG